MTNRVLLELSGLSEGVYTMLDLVCAMKAVAMDRIIISPSLGKRVGHSRVP